jgi:signal peptidase I
MPKAGRISFGVLLAFFVVVLAGAALLVHDGYRVYVVHTGSMIPAYNPGDVVVDSPATALRPGEVITFFHSGLSNDLVTHRITGLSKGVIHTKGDANATADVWDIRPDQVQGSVVTSVPYVGYALVYLKQPLGFASLLTVAGGLLLLWQLFFSSSSALTLVVAADSGRRYKRGLDPSPAATSGGWPTSKTSDLPVGGTATYGLRGGRSSQDHRQGSLNKDISDSTSAPVGRHRRVHVAGYTPTCHRIRTGRPESFSQS